MKRKICLIAFIFFSVFFFLSLPHFVGSDTIESSYNPFQKQPVTKSEYSPSSETHCTDNKCLATFYPEIRYSDSKGTKKEDTYSLKDCEFNDSFILTIDEDRDYPVKVLDYNLTTMILETTITSKNKDKDIPLSIDGVVKKNVRSDKATASVEILTDENLLGKTIKYGSNSTTISLVGNNVTINGYITYKDGLYDSTTTGSAKAGVYKLSYWPYTYYYYRSFFQFNLSLIPDSINLESATIYIKCTSPSGTGGTAEGGTNVNHITDIGASLDSSDWSKSILNSYGQLYTGVCSLQTYYNMNVTSSITSTELSADTVTYRLQDSIEDNDANYQYQSWLTKEAGSGYWPYLTIVYTEAPPPDTTAPTYTNFNSNTTNNTAISTNQWINISALWTDNIQLDKCVNSSKVNTSGSWANGTWASVGTGNWTNYTMRFPSEAGSNLTVRIYCNDTSGEGNVTGTLFWYNVVDSTPPTLNLIKAGSGKHTQNYTMRSYQSESYMEINVSSNENVSTCILQWNNGSKTNYTMTIDGTKRYCAYNITNQPSGIDYTFIVFANDTSNNWANYTWYKMDALTGVWNETKYARLNSTVGSIDYQGSLYLYTAQGEYDKDYAGMYSQKVLYHEQGIDGTNTDTGYLKYERDSEVDDSIYCIAFVGAWFENNVTIPYSTVTNTYIHLWFIGDEVGGNNSFGFIKELTNGPNTGPRNLTIWKDNISTTQDIGGTTYYLMTGLIDFQSDPVYIDENDIYDYNLKMRSGPGSGNPKLYNHRNASSFILINVPDNATLSGLDSDSDGMSDFLELYGNFTDPFYNDTDNDGVNDRCDSNPNLPSIEENICEAKEMLAFHGISSSSHPNYKNVKSIIALHGISDFDIHAYKMISEFLSYNGITDFQSTTLQKMMSFMYANGISFSSFRGNASFNDIMAFHGFSDEDIIGYKQLYEYLLAQGYSDDEIASYMKIISLAGLYGISEEDISDRASYNESGIFGGISSFISKTTKAMKNLITFIGECVLSGILSVKGFLEPSSHSGEGDSGIGHSMGMNENWFGGSFASFISMTKETATDIITSIGHAVLGIGRSIVGIIETVTHGGLSAFLSTARAGFYNFLTAIGEAVLGIIDDLISSITPPSGAGSSGGETTSPVSETTQILTTTMEDSGESVPVDLIVNLTMEDSFCCLENISSIYYTLSVQRMDSFNFSYPINLTLRETLIENYTIIRNSTGNISLSSKYLENRSMPISPKDLQYTFILNVSSARHSVSFTHPFTFDSLRIVEVPSGNVVLLGREISVRQFAIIIIICTILIMTIVLLSLKFANMVRKSEEKYYG